MPSLQQKLLLPFSGGTPAISVSGDTDFGTTPVGTPVSEIFTIENTGTAPLIISSISVPSGFTLTDPVAFPLTIAPNASDTFTIEADALTGEVFSGNVSIVSNAATSPTLLAITVFVAYLIDKFASGVWPSGSGTRTSDIGQLTVVDTGTNISMGSGLISYSNVVGANNPIVHSASLTRTKGLTALFRNSILRDRAFSGWYNAALSVIAAAAESETTAAAYIGGEATTGVMGTTSGTAYDVACVLDTSGGSIYIRPAGVGDYVLRWRDNIGSDANVRAYHAAINTSGVVRSLDEMVVMQDSNNILINPTQNVASPVSAQTYAGTASAIIEVTLAVVTMSDASGIKFRVQDANNYWYAYFDSAGAFKVDRIINGSPDGGSPYVNVAAVQVNGGTRRIRVRANGTSLDFYTKSAGGAGTWTKRGGTISDLLLGAYSDIIPVAGSTYTISNLRSDKLFDAAITTLLESWTAP